MLWSYVTKTIGYSKYKFIQNHNRIWYKSSDLKFPIHNMVNMLWITLVALDCYNDKWILPSHLLTSKKEKLFNLDVFFVCYMPIANFHDFNFSLMKNIYLNE